MRTRIEVQVLFHACTPNPTYRRGIELLDRMTLEENRRRVWADFRAGLPGRGLLEGKSEAELRAETAGVGDAETCPRGHPWTPENTGRQTNGSRRCKACRREKARAT